MRKINLLGLLIGLCALVVVSNSCNESSEDQMIFYVGSYSSATEPGIYSCQFDAASGRVKVLNATFGIENPSYIALAPNERYLYSVSEVANYDNSEGGGIYAYKINADKSLKLINSVSSGGAHPCHLSIHPSGKLLVAANYSGGNIASVRINPDGALNPSVQSVQHLGSGPNKDRQQKAHAHSANILGDGKFMYACDLGIDKVMGYDLDLNEGRLTPADNSTISMAPGAGPRHMAFSPNSNFAFVINELNSTITSCSLDNINGTLAILSSVSSLPTEIGTENYCADIHVHPSGDYLYASNRGHNSIAVFKIGNNGELTMIQTHSTLGDWPRNFAIDPSGKFLLVANQRSDNIAVLEIDPKSGKLSDTGEGFEVVQPVCIVFRK